MTKSLFSRKYFSSDLIQSSRCTTDWWLILIFQVKKWIFISDRDLWRRIDQFEVTNYSWISNSLNSNLLLSHMDLSLTDFMIINSWHKRVVTFVTRDSVLHLAMNLCSVLNLDGLVTTTDYQTMRISWPAQHSWSIGFSVRLWLVFVDILDLSSKFGRTDIGYKITLVTLWL